MNKYSDREDYEINLAVAKKLGHQPSLECGVVKIEEELRHGKIVTSSDFDPCNNPYDAMPIIIENKIPMKPHPHKLGAWECGGVGMYSSIHKNPYRAAMEVFLMMKDAE